MPKWIRFNAAKGEIPMRNLLEVLGNVDTSTESGYCHQQSAFPQFNNKSGKEYRDWEKEIATPKLKELGYNVVCWINGDADSFGPLTRVAVVSKNGKKEELIYG